MGWARHPRAPGDINAVHSRCQAPSDDPATWEITDWVELDSTLFHRYFVGQSDPLGAVAQVWSEQGRFVWRVQLPRPIRESWWGAANTITHAKKQAHQKLESMLKRVLLDDATRLAEKAKKELAQAKAELELHQGLGRLSALLDEP